MVYGDYCPVMEEYENIVAYTRAYEGEKWLMLFNFQAQEVSFPQEFRELVHATPLMQNYPDLSAGFLRPYDARIYQIT